MIEKNSSKMAIATTQICPKYRPDLFDGDAALGMLDTSLTPSALKKLSKSVMDLSSMSEMQEISKSTSNLMTGSIFTKSVFKKRFKSVAAATSKTSLLRSSADSLSTIEVRRPRLIVFFAGDLALVSMVKGFEVCF